jgi:hypothetical protein
MVCLVQLGHRTLNLEYMVTAEDSRGEPPPKTIPIGVLRVTIEGGRVLDLSDDQAERLRTVITELVYPQLAPAAVRSRGVSSRRPRKE